jgi:mono/diheme cytochrome c family protein
MTLPRLPRPALIVTSSALACVGLSFALSAGCGSARKQPIPDERIAADPQLAHGRLVFMHHCNPCHVGGAAGLGPALNDKPLPAVAIRTQVRKGVGTMPAFDEQHITDEQLDALVKYLQVLRQQEPLAEQPVASR